MLLVGDGQICNPGLTAIWEDENKRRLTTESTPLEIPPLHSQRPACEPTSSEGFYLRRIQEILENASQVSCYHTTVRGISRDFIFTLAVALWYYIV